MTFMFHALAAWLDHVAHRAGRRQWLQFGHEFGLSALRSLLSLSLSLSLSPPPFLSLSSHACAQWS